MDSRIFNSLLHPINCNCSVCGGYWFKSTDFSRLLKHSMVPEGPFRVQLEMPGTKKRNISLKRRGDFIYVDYSTRYGESKTYSTFVGDKLYDMEKMTASYEDGLLSIEVPPREIKPPEPTPEPEIDIEIK